MEWKNLDQLSSFRTLQSDPHRVDLVQAMSGENGVDRVTRYRVPMGGGLTYYYAAKQVDDQILTQLCSLAQEAGLAEKFAELYNGAVINTGEKRKVLHQLTRGQLGNDVIDGTENKREFYLEQQRRIAEFAGKGNRAYARMNMIRADVVLSSTPGLDVYQWKRSRDVKWYVHIPHGIYDLTAYRMFGLDYYDAVLLVGSFQKETVRKLEEERNLPEKELTVVGMPYMDEMLKRKEAEKESEAADQAEGAGTKTVLLASSWGASSLLNRYQGKIIDALLQTDVHIIVRPHPQSYTSEKDLIERLMKEYPESDRLEWDQNDDNYESLKRADLLISDFSGVIITAGNVIIENGCNVEGLVIAGDRIYIYGNNNIVSSREIVNAITQEEAAAPSGTVSANGSSRRILDYIGAMPAKGVIIAP